MDVRDVGLIALGAGVGVAVARYFAASSDDQPIIVGGGSLYIGASGKHQWAADPTDPAQLRHETEGHIPTKGRIVTQVDVFTPDKSDSFTPSGNVLRLILECARRERIVFSSNPNRGLTIGWGSGNAADHLDPANPAFIDLGECSVTKIDIPPHSYTLGEGDHFLITIHFVGVDPKGRQSGGKSD